MTITRRTGNTSKANMKKTISQNTSQRKITPTKEKQQQHETQDKQAKPSKDKQSKQNKHKTSSRFKSETQLATVTNGRQAPLLVAANEVVITAHKAAVMIVKGREKRRGREGESERRREEQEVECVVNFARNNKVRGRRGGEREEGLKENA